MLHQKHTLKPSLGYLEANFKGTLHHLDETIAAFASIQEQWLLTYSQRSVKHQWDNLHNIIAEQDHHLRDILEAAQEIRP